MINIRTHGLESTIAEIDKGSELIRDFRPLFRELIEDVVIDYIEEIFISQGFNTWPPRLDDLPHPLLIKTGALLNSLTNISDSNNIFEVSDDSVTFGSRLDYSEYVQYRRPILDFLENSIFEQEVSLYLDKMLQRAFDRIGIVGGR